MCGATSGELLIASSRADCDVTVFAKQISALDASPTFNLQVGRAPGRRNLFSGNQMSGRDVDGSRLKLGIWLIKCAHTNGFSSI